MLNVCRMVLRRQPHRLPKGRPSWARGPFKPAKSGCDGLEGIILKNGLDHIQNPQQYSTRRTSLVYEPYTSINRKIAPQVIGYIISITFWPHKPFVITIEIGQLENVDIWTFFFLVLEFPVQTTWKHRILIQPKSKVQWVWYPAVGLQIYLCEKTSH